MSSVKIATKPDLREQMFEVGRAARAAAEQLAEARADVKRAALEAAAQGAARVGEDRAARERG